MKASSCILDNQTYKTASNDLLPCLLLPNLAAGASLPPAQTYLAPAHVPNMLDDNIVEQHGADCTSSWPIKGQGCMQSLRSTPPSFGHNSNRQIRSYNSVSL
jgi:hypothetical protein